MSDRYNRVLTPAIKKQITRDWQKHFPAFAIYKPMWLLRRVGPVVIGIILERDSSNDIYKPTFHIHNLAIPFPTISLTLSNQLKSKSGGQDFITVRSHDETHLKAIERFREACFLPCEGPVSYKQVLKAYEEKKSRNRHEKLYDMEIADMALISAWANRPRKARKYLKRALRMMGDSVPWIDQDYGSVSAWRKHMETIIQKPEAMQRCVEEQIIEHRLQNIPVSDFLV